MRIDEFPLNHELNKIIKSRVQSAHEEESFSQDD